MSLPETRFSTARADRARVINIANAAPRWARRFISLDADDWVRRAVAAVEGASESDVGFREELRLLCAGLERDGDLHFIGRPSARDDTVRMIRTQLRVRRALAEGAGSLPELMLALFMNALRTYQFDHARVCRPPLRRAGARPDRDAGGPVPRARSRAAARGARHDAGLCRRAPEGHAGWARAPLSLEQFGLRAAEVRERFQGYIERYGVASEAGAG